METKTNHAINMYLNDDYGQITLYAFEDDGLQIWDTIIHRLDLDIDEGDQDTWAAINFIFRVDYLNESNFHDNFSILDEWVSPGDLDKGEKTPQLIRQFLNELKEIGEK